MSWERLAGTALLATGLLLVAGPAAPDAGTCPNTITQLPVILDTPGTYCLASDLSYDGGDAVSVLASGVTVDLQGFTLSSLAGPQTQATGISAIYQSNVTVRNGVITGFRAAVDLEGAGGHTVTGIRAVQNWYIGIDVDGPLSTVQDCEVISTGGSLVPGDTIPFGIGAGDNGVVVTGNLVQDVYPPPGGEAIGINVQPGTGTNVLGNVVVNTELQDSTWGLWTVAPSSTIGSNLFIRYSYGIVYAAPSSGSYSGNTFFNVTNPVAVGTSDVLDLGNATVRSFCEPVYSLPLVISAQGSYCLLRDVSTPIASGDAILIASDDVRLDLRGFKVDGGAAGPPTQAVGIHAVNQRNVTIVNGDVHGFAKGVFLEDTSSDLSAGVYRVERILADENTVAGIHVQGRAFVRRNQVVATGTGGGGASDSYGIRVEGSLARVLDNDVSDTTASSGTAFSIAVTSGGGAVLEGNRVSGTAGGSSVGIFLGSASSATAVGNRILATSTGLFFSGSSGVYRGNMTTGTGSAFVGGTDVGSNN